MRDEIKGFQELIAGYANKNNVTSPSPNTPLSNPLSNPLLGTSNIFASPYPISSSTNKSNSPAIPAPAIPAPAIPAPVIPAPVIPSSVSTLPNIPLMDSLNSLCINNATATSPALGGGTSLTDLNLFNPNSSFMNSNIGSGINNNNNKNNSNNNSNDNSNSNTFNSTSPGMLFDTHSPQNTYNTNDITPSSTKTPAPSSTTGNMDPAGRTVSGLVRELFSDFTPNSNVGNTQSSATLDFGADPTSIFNNNTGSNNSSNNNSNINEINANCNNEYRNTSPINNADSLFAPNSPMVTSPMPSPLPLDTNNANYNNNNNASNVNMNNSNSNVNFNVTSPMNINSPMNITTSNVYSGSGSGGHTDDLNQLLNLTSGHNSNSSAGAGAEEFLNFLRGNAL
eukprot:Awhi_evm1s10765